MKKIAFTVAVLALTTPLTLKAQKKVSKPNMLLFLADDCSYLDLGIYGSKNAKTPNIDKFATEGMQFTHGYQAAPMSSPTRHNLYTGLWPVKTGAYPNHTFAREGTLSIVHHLKPAGYRVALIGKSHVAPQTVFPFEYIPLKRNNDLDFEAIDNFIASCTESKTPFCLFVTSNQPHTPWNKGDATQFNPDSLQLPPFYVDTPNFRKDLCRYYAEINYMDAEFGKVLNKIDKYKQQENTVVVFLSEQGNSLPFAKWTCYDVGVHSAYIVRWPNVVKQYTKSDALVEYIDIVPTFIDIAGTKPLSELDGKSIVPILKGNKKVHKKYTFSLQTTRGIINGSDHYGIRSAANHEFRYILNLTPDEKFENAETKSKNFKEWLSLANTNPKAKELTYKYQHRPAVELYNIKNDPYCMQNLAGKPEYEKIQSELDKALHAWMKSCGDLGAETEMDALNHLNKQAASE